MSERPIIHQAMLEYAQATRGDWSDFDGRCMLHQMEAFIVALEGGRGSDWSLARWRDDLGVCPTGHGHWSGPWGHCSESCTEGIPE